LSSPNIGSDATTKFAAMHTLPDRPKRADADYTSFTGEIVSPLREKPSDGGKNPPAKNFSGRRVTRAAMYSSKVEAAAVALKTSFRRDYPS
jgi:hypothetical protein